jgi:hypothetical protein
MICRFSDSLVPFPFLLPNAVLSQRLWQVSSTQTRCAAHSTTWLENRVAWQCDTQTQTGTLPFPLSFVGDVVIQPLEKPRLLRENQQLMINKLTATSELA